MQNEGTEERTRAELPELAAMVRRYHPEAAVQRVIVLDMWRALAKIPSWTPRMVRAVEREIR